MKVNIESLTDQWEFKMFQNNRHNSTKESSFSKKSKIFINSLTNSTVPAVNFLKSNTKLDSIFELELLSEKGYYYRISFTNSKIESPDKIPDSYDVYCEIKIANTI